MVNLSITDILQLFITKYMFPKIPKLVLLALIITVISSGVFSLFQYGTFAFVGHKIALAASTSFNDLEDFFQNQPEEVPTPIITEVSPIKVPIIIYHSIRPYIPGESAVQDRYDITPELFEQQLAYLQNHNYTPISIDALATYIQTGTTTPIMKPVVLTFDDGWENQYKYAFPLLKKYNMVGTFYVYTKPIDNMKPHFLTWDQIREMSAAGMTIGSHTLTHPILRDSSPVDMRREIFDSKNKIETEIKKPVLDFAQPFGYSSPEIEALIKEAGYLTARGTHKGVYQSKADIFNLQGYFTSDNFNDFIYILNH